MGSDADPQLTIRPPAIRSGPLWLIAALSLLLALPLFPHALLITVPLGALVGAAVYAALRSAATWQAVSGSHRQLAERLLQLEVELAALRAARGAQAAALPAAPSAESAAGIDAAAAPAAAATVAASPPPMATPTPAPDLDFALPDAPAPLERPVRAAGGEATAGAAPPSAQRPAGVQRARTSLQGAISAARDWLFGGNTVARVGLLVLFVGVAFLLRYVAERTQVPIELRLAAVALGALAFLVLGWRLRWSRPGFAVTLQGGAIGILYLTVFAALRLYDVMAPPLAFGVMALLAVLSGVLAVLQDARALAALGAAGGFAAPLLVSTGEGRIGLLFSYYLVLNLGVLGVALFRAWRELNWIAFGFTFAVSGLWAVQRYTPQDYALGQGFLIVFWLLFLAVSLLYALRQRGERRGLFDTSLVFALPLAAFGIQARFTEGFELAVASTVAAAAYLAVSAWLLRRRDPTLQLLTEATFALGVGFLTLAVPLAASAQWTAAAWALEGIALLWVGLRQQRALPTVAGLLLHVAGAVALLAAVDRGEVSLAPALSGATLNLAVCAATAFASAWLMQRGEALRSALPAAAPQVPALARLLGWGWVAVLLWQPLAFPWYGFAWCGVAVALLALARAEERVSPEWIAGVALVILAALASVRTPLEASGHLLLVLRLAVAASAVAGALLSLGSGGAAQRTGAAALLTLGVLAWLVALLAETMARIDAQLAVAQIALALIGITAFALGWLGQRVGWRWPLQLGASFFAAHLVFAAYVVALAVFSANLPSVHFGWALWPAAWLLFYGQLARTERAAALPHSGALHVGGLWLLVLMLAAELALRVDRVAGEGWFHAAWGAVIALGLWLTVQHALRWPMRAAPFAYASIGVPGLAALALAWLLWGGLQAADPSPLPAWPLINPLDLAALLVLAALLRWHLADSRPQWHSRVRVAIGAAAFFVVNVIAVRAVHMTAGVPWDADALLRSLLVQAVLSLLWTLIAMALMVAAHRRALRPLWMLGAALLAAVVAKLFFVDLSGQGTIERIVSFVGVGLLILAVGYLAPVPPAALPRTREATT